jgi:simple sugar transport system permease protein
MSAVLDQIFQVGFLAAIIRIATPLAFATLGEMFSERAGVLNLGIEGIMLLSAMAGFTAASLTGSLWIGVLAAMLAGAAMAALHALLTVALGLSQHVCGIGITLLSSGLAYFFYRLIFGQQSVPPSIVGFKTVPIPILKDIPVLGPAVFDQFALVYLAIAAIPVAAFVLYRTPWGLSVRMVGENPRAADSAGVSVIGTRFQAVMLGGALMGLAGAFLSMAQFNAFTFGVVSGRGWIAIALVVFGRWDPWRSAGAALLFAFVDALQLRLQASGLGHIPYEAFLMLPFVLTIVAMAFMSRNAVAPSALLQPFRKEER